MPTSAAHRRRRRLSRGSSPTRPWPSSMSCSSPARRPCRDRRRPRRRRRRARRRPAVEARFIEVDPDVVVVPGGLGSHRHRRDRHLDPPRPARAGCSPARPVRPCSPPAARRSAPAATPGRPAAAARRLAATHCCPLLERHGAIPAATASSRWAVRHLRRAGLDVRSRRCRRPGGRRGRARPTDPPGHDAPTRSSSGGRARRRARSPPGARAAVVRSGAAEASPWAPPPELDDDLGPESMRSTAGVHQPDADPSEGLPAPRIVERCARARRPESERAGPARPPSAARPDLADAATPSRSPSPTWRGRRTCRPRTSAASSAARSASRRTSTC